MFLESGRLQIRRLGPGDEPLILELLNQPSFLHNIGDRNVRTLRDAATYIQSGPVVSYGKFGFGLFHVSLKEGAIPIGICGLVKRDWLPDPDIGFAYLERHWRRGYALEAAQTVMDYARNTLNLKRIVAITAPHNEASIRLLGKIGLQFEGMITIPGSTTETKLFSLNS
jgi:[ribosomal protein S5]-alanine N-acetyltransferase